MNNLPRGIRLDHGYIQVRISHRGRMYCKNFGKDSPLARELASIHLSEKRKEILMGTFGITSEAPSLKFKEAAKIYFNEWNKETDADGALRHSEKSRYMCKLVLDNNLSAWFNNRYVEDIKPKDIEAWRSHRLSRVCGTTANREQNVLSSMFSHLEKWVKTEKIKGFKLPPENPCNAVEKASTRKRERILTQYEASKLHLSSVQLNDPDGWEIIKFALKSVLSLGDLQRLEIGDIIDTEREKTGVAVTIPIAVLSKLNFRNWRARWIKIRNEAGLRDLQFRDLRKSGMNWLKGRHDLKLISEYGGHANIKTTESFYTVKDSSQMKPLADDLSNIVDSL